MATRELTLDQVDLCDLDTFQHGDPNEYFDVLRREAPVHWHERSWGKGFWAVTKYDDLLNVSIDPYTFVSSRGIVLDNDGVRTAREKRLEEQGGYEMDARGRMLIMSDPPRHTDLRQLVNKDFTRKGIAYLEAETRKTVTRILDEVCERGECDFVLDMARKLPLEVICELMGVPEGDWESMFEMTNRVIGFDDPEYGEVTEEISEAEMQLTAETLQYFFGLIADRRENETHDLLSKLVRADMNGTKLEDIDIYLFFILLIIAGNETTRNATTGGMIALTQHPDQYKLLVDDPSLIPNAVEEIVRWTSPVMHFVRVASRDTEIRGHKISEGDEVCIWYPSANRDEDMFENPHVFDVTRDPNPHIAFGKGEHFCLGANLARLELRVMFEEICKRMPDIEPAGEPEKLRSNFINGVKRWPVTFTPSVPVGG